MTATPRLELEGLSKSFGSFRALREVGLSVMPGETHAVVGQNGSGKSTLIKILAGYHAPDRGGRILVDGAPLPLPARLRDLRAAGIALVHQDFGLLDERSVAENIAVGAFAVRRRSRRVDWAAERARAAEILARLDVRGLAPDTLVGGLDPAQRSAVAIARALRNQRPGEGLLVLDESTRALPKDGLEDFYRVLRTVVGAGGAALMVSHNLQEVLRVADKVTVLRDGQVVEAARDAADLTERDVARMMLGRTVTQARHVREPSTGGGPPVQVRGLRGRALQDLDLDIAPGEVVGVTGVAGGGWEEIPYLLAAARRARAGRVRVAATALDLARADSVDCIRAGIALLPENRIAHGLATTLTVAENVTLPRVRQHGRRFAIGRAWQLNEVAAVLRDLDVRPRRADVPVGQLSGGNQQKVMLGKWLAGRPRLLLLHEPTQAVDVGAREDILRAISATARQGVAVLFASIQPADLAAVCDRVLVVRDGRVAAEVDEPTEQAVVESVYADDRASAAQKG
ncbi:ATP-binding cassette domain-containing protein [Actinomadura syzygii]|uniref:ATP-binding cassette domain-containing protein n=1 Tax=Actinomadura syzygii TaxID=1427538 RepID=UPI0036167CF8